MDQALIDVLDEAGLPIGSKPRSEVDRRQDILPVAHIFVLTTHRELLLAEIAQHQDQKRIYAGQWGTPAVTFIRHGEAPQEAARRALAHDLGIENAEPKELGTTFDHYADGVRRWVSAFVYVADKPAQANPREMKDLRPFTRETLLQEIKDAEKFAPSFVATWNHYQQLLPF